MGKNETRNIEIFRTGTHTDMKGETFTWTADTVKGIAAGYNAADGEAPVVVGHPRTDDPAYGWVKGLHFREEDGVLTADIHRLDPDFQLMVRDGKFKKISSSFDKTGDGSFSLRHVGFLGAAKPAVPGLKAVSFGDEPSITFEFAGSTMSGDITWALGDVITILRSFRDYFIEKFGLEVADKVLPSWRLESASRNAAKAQAANIESEFANKGGEMPSEELKSAESPEKEQAATPANGNSEFATGEKEKLTARLETLEKEQADFDKEHKFASAEAEVKTLVEQGKITPAQSRGLAQFMATLPDDRAAAVSFAADGIAASIADGIADGSEEKVSPRAYVSRFLGALPPQVAFGEAAENLHGEVEASASALAERISAHVAEQKKNGRNVSFSDALNEVTAKGDQNG